MRRAAVLVVGALAALVCARLGFWQLDRLAARRALNAEIRAALALPPRELVPAPGGDTSNAAPYRQATAHGTFDFDRQLIVVGRSVDGVPGVVIVTPLRLADGGAILVERGWHASADARSVDLAVLMEPESTVVHGVLLPAPESGAPHLADMTWPRYVRAAVPVELASAVPYRLRPQVLRRATIVVGAPAALRPVPPPALTSGPHLSYAVQWFAFAAIAVVGSALLYRKSRTEVQAVGEG